MDKTIGSRQRTVPCLRCCIRDRKNKYRGIDREISMRLFNQEKDSVLYQIALERYVEYLSVEGSYTIENLALITSFADWVNKKYAECETLIFSSTPLEDMDMFEFLGVDIVDDHLRSILKKGKIARFLKGKAENHKLIESYSDAQCIIGQIKTSDDKYDDLSCGYVYLVHSNRG